MMTMISEKDNIHFTEDNFQLTTDSGEKFSKPYGLLSTPVNIHFAYKDSETGSGDYHVTLTYILEKTKADSLEEVHLHTKSATDQNGDALGDDIHVDIPLTITDFE